MDNYTKYFPILIFVGGIILFLYSLGPTVTYSVRTYGYATINNGANSTSTYRNATGSYVTIPTAQYNQIEVGQYLWLAVFSIIALVASVAVIESGRSLRKIANKKMSVIALVSSIISFGMLYLVYNDISIVIIGFILALIGSVLSFVYT